MVFKYKVRGKLTRNKYHVGDPRG